MQPTGAAANNLHYISFLSDTLKQVTDNRKINQIHIMLHDEKIKRRSETNMFYYGRFVLVFL